MANERSPWPTMVTLGVLCGITLGAVLLLIIFRDRKTQALLPESTGFEGLGALSWSPDDEFSPRTRRRSLPKPPILPAEIKTVGSRPIARTVTISNRRPTVLLKAVGLRNWTVWVRVVGPAGSFATFIIGHTTGDSIEVPAGGFHQMQIPSGEFLYAQGDQVGVSVSVSGGEA